MQPDLLADRFALGTVVACEPIAEGLMNPNWRLTTSAGVFAVKQLRPPACPAPSTSPRPHPFTDAVVRRIASSG